MAALRLKDASRTQLQRAQRLHRREQRATSSPEKGCEQGGDPQRGERDNQLVGQQHHDHRADGGGERRIGVEFSHLLSGLKVTRVRFGSQRSTSHTMVKTLSLSIGSEVQDCRNTAVSWSKPRPR